MNFNNYFHKLNDYFKDSYGLDKLSKNMIIFGAVFSVTKVFSILGLGLIGYSTWRVLSKNKFRRYQELQAYERYVYRLKERTSSKKLALSNSRYYKIFKCPNCSQKLRVPRKQGKITITCRKCSTEFKGKS